MLLSGNKLLYFIFGLILLGNALFWNHSKTMQTPWDNVPPAPSREFAPFLGLGDREVAHRLVSYMLLGLGNVGGRFESLREYDYERLKDWFFIAHFLNEKSDTVPMLAAYYFGAVDVPKKIPPVTDYLVEAGQVPIPEKWRWMAHAIYLTRFTENNPQKALEMAEIMASLPTETAVWARQMPAFIQLQLGNKEAAYEIMIRMLESEGGQLHPNEVNFMKGYICDRLLDSAQAAVNPLCQ